MTEERWTKFFDMASGGSDKLEWEEIIVNLPEKEAITWFEKKFGRNPNNVTCDCCGADYSIDEYETFEDVSKHVKESSAVFRIEEDK